jgi:3-dehydroquinate synthase
MPSVKVRLKTCEQSYEVKVDSGLLSGLGTEVRACLGPDARRAAIISNRAVFNLYGKAATQSLESADFKVTPWLIGDGERYKTLRTLNQTLDFLTASYFERNDAVIALGGGVVGDLAGFAAATYQRGITFVQVPTTLLAQIDASVGGKTGVNTPAGKNLVGAFHQPSAVLIDTNTLATLPRRELTAGWCEAIKHGAVGSRKLFDQTCSFLRSSSKGLVMRHAQNESTKTKPYDTRLNQLIAAHCRFKASIVAHDEREDIGRNDLYSRKILNFGHTTAHALESVTQYRRFRHGEAVGYGMLVAGEMSKKLGMIANAELELLREAVRLCGPLPRANDLSIAEIMRRLTRDKKSVSGKIKWVLLERIGRARIVDDSAIEPKVLRESLRAGLRQS